MLPSFKFHSLAEALHQGFARRTFFVCKTVFESDPILRLRFQNVKESTLAISGATRSLFELPEDKRFNRDRQILQRPVSLAIAGTTDSPEVRFAESTPFVSPNGLLGL
jgi:hypothetical protein